MKNIQKMWKKEEGFTLIELIIVIAILAILAAVAIPNIMTSIDDSRKTTDITNARIIAEAAAIVRAKNDDLAGLNITAAADIVDVTALAASAAATDTGLAKFKGELYDELSKNSPKPKYQGGGTGDSFDLSIDDGAIKVTCDATGSTVELYPVPKTPYVD